MRCKIITEIFLLTTYLLAQPATQFSGDVHLFDAHRLSDRSLINLPWRMLNLKIDHQNGDFNIFSLLSIENRIRTDDSFFISSNPQEFSLDWRELYFNWNLPSGRVRVGKQIHSWSSVDDNSPIDNINSYDYYYIFNLGTERKLASMGMTFDYYFKKTKLGFYFSPLHHTNRIPLNDPDFPIQLPVTPRADQMVSPNEPYEFGLHVQHKTKLADFSLTYFKGYDRLFSLSGTNVFTNQFQTVSVLDTVYSFRKTEMLGAGIVLPTKWFIVRAEAAHFFTFDPLDTMDIKHEHYRYPNVFPDIMFSHAFKTKATYYETIVQLETELPFDIDFIGQYFKYDTLSFDANYLPDINLPLLEADFDPYSVFFPGMGTPLAILTQEAWLMIFNKSFWNERLLFETLFLFDQTEFNGFKGKGKMMDIKSTYDLTQALKLTTALTIITGDKDLDETYRFNEMEDFSHLRFELKYYF